MPADFTAKQGDSAPTWEDTLTYSNGEAVDLEGATVELMLRNLAAAAPLTPTGELTVVNAKGGQIAYRPSKADTASAGSLMGNWHVTFPDGAEMTFPTEGYLSITIEENLSIPGIRQLVSLGEVKEHLGIPANLRTQDEKLTTLIEAVRPLIEYKTGPIIPQRFEEWHDGGATYILLRRRPSTSLGTTPFVTLVACSEYMGPIEWPLKIVASPDEGELYSCMLDPTLWRVVRRTAGGDVQPFPAMPQSVHVVYEAGLREVPSNVRWALKEALREFWQTTQQTGRGRMTQADAEETPGRSLAFLIARHALGMIGPMKRAPSLA